MTRCLGCGRALTQRHQKIYCSNACQMQVKQKLVCPNCDSQLPTYKAKNRGSGRAWRRQRYADGKSY